MNIPRPSTSTWETVGVPESSTVLMISAQRPMNRTKAPIVVEPAYGGGRELDPA